MNRIPREEIIAITAFALCCLFFGGIAGWGLRTVSSRDRLIISQVERNNAERISFLACAGAAGGGK